MQLEKQGTRKKEEEQNQVAVVSWFRFQYPCYKDLITIPSFGENIGGRRMRRLKQMGLTPGWPDIFIAIPKRLGPDKPIISAGLFIEMKSSTGRLTQAQKDMHEVLRYRQYRVIVCRGFDEAMQGIKDYLGDMVLSASSKQ